VRACAASRAAGDLGIRAPCARHTALVSSACDGSFLLRGFLPAKARLRRQACKRAGRGSAARWCCRKRRHRVGRTAGRDLLDSARAIDRCCGPGTSPKRHEQQLVPRVEAALRGTSASAPRGECTLSARRAPAPKLPSGASTAQAETGARLAGGASWQRRRPPARRKRLFPPAGSTPLLHQPPHSRPPLYQFAWPTCRLAHQQSESQEQLFCPVCCCGLRLLTLQPRWRPVAALLILCLGLAETSTTGRAAACICRTVARCPPAFWWASPWWWRDQRRQAPTALVMPRGDQDPGRNRQRLEPRVG